MVVVETRQLEEISMARTNKQKKERNCQICEKLFSPKPNLKHKTQIEMKRVDVKCELNSINMIVDANLDQKIFKLFW